MKTFISSVGHADTCGNTWTEDNDPVKYYNATSIKRLWEHLGKPRVTKYWIHYGMDEKPVSMHRTPKGCGYGIWEDNPEFDFDKDLKAEKVTSFECGGFVSLMVREVKVETVT